MTLRMGQRDLELGGAALGTLRDSNDILNDPVEQRERMEQDGYLLIRGLQPVEKVTVVRDMLLANLDANGQIDRGFPLEQGVMKEGGRGAFLGGSKTITRSRPFLDLVDSPQIMGFFANFLRSDVLTFDYKWLRVVAPGDFTGAHYDVVYMGRGTHNLFTCWTPITDVPYEMGPLAILVGSHRGAGFEKVRATYGRMDVDRDHVTGAFSDDPAEMVEKFGGQWQTTEFRRGDVLLFSMYTMHGSLNNVSRSFRLSADTRYQRADDPVDERWVGEDPPAHYSWMAGPTVSMEEARRTWDV